MIGYRWTKSILTCPAPPLERRTVDFAVITGSMQTPLTTPSSAICAAGRFAADQRSASKQPQTPFCGRMEGSSAKAWRHGSRYLSGTSGARSASWGCIGQGRKSGGEGKGGSGGGEIG